MGSVARARVPGPLAPLADGFRGELDRAGCALRYSALGSTGHASHQEQASMIGRDSIWRNNHACDERLRRIIDPGNVA